MYSAGCGAARLMVDEKALQSWRVTMRLPVWRYVLQLDNCDQEGESHCFPNQQTQRTDLFLPIAVKQFEPCTIRGCN